MSKLVELNLQPDARTLRQFGWIALVGFLGVAALAWFEKLIFAFGLGEARTVVAGTIAGLGLLAAFFSVVYPKANLPIYLGLTVIAFPIGFVVSYVIMGTLFYVLITPVALFFRLIGRDPLHRRFEPEAESYWVTVPEQRPNESYFKQF